MGTIEENRDSMKGPSEHPEGSGYARLRASQSLGEVLNTAISFEETAREFYIGLRDRVGKPLRELVTELAEEETRHCQLFQDIASSPQVQDRLADRIQTPPSDHRFSDYIQLPDLGTMPDDQSILQYALGREQAAMEQYASLAEATPAGPLQDLFRFLSQEELQHKSELEKRYYELVYPSNV